MTNQTITTINATGIDFIDITRTVIERDLIGTTEAAVFFMMFIAIVSLLIIGAKREAVLAIPIPMVVAFATSGTAPIWVRVIPALLLAVYLAQVLRNVVKK